MLRCCTLGLVFSLLPLLSPSASADEMEVALEGLRQARALQASDIQFDGLFSQTNCEEMMDAARQLYEIDPYQLSYEYPNQGYTQVFPNMCWNGRARYLHIKRVQPQEDLRNHFGLPVKHVVKAERLQHSPVITLLSDTFALVEQYHAGTIKSIDRDGNLYYRSGSRNRALFIQKKGPLASARFDVHAQDPSIHLVRVLATDESYFLVPTWNRSWFGQPERLGRQPMEYQFTVMRLREGEVLCRASITQDDEGTTYQPDQAAYDRCR